MNKFYLKEFIKIFSKILISDKDGIYNKYNARWQEAILALSMYNPKKYKNKILRGIDKWISLQNKDGSFPEEKTAHSYSATAFSLYAVAKSLNIIKIIDKKKEKAIRNASKFLSSHQKLETPNQEIFAGLALIESSEIIEIYAEEGIKKIKSVIDLQDEEGWFPEYEGPDIGYGSLILQGLGLVYQKGILKKEILTSAKKFIDWVKYFIFPDGSVGGSYNRRTGGWLILDGFEIFKRKIPICKRIINLHIQGHERGIFNASHIIDKRHIMTDAWRLLSAHQNSKNLKLDLARLPCESEFEKYFKNSNIFIIRKDNFMLIANANEKSRSGITLWKPNCKIIDLNKLNPELTETKLIYNHNSIQIKGFWRAPSKILNRLGFKRIWCIIKYIFQYNIRIIFKDDICISSNKSIIFSGFGLEGTQIIIKYRDNIFLNKNDFQYIKTKKIKL